MPSPVSVQFVRRRTGRAASLLAAITVLGAVPSVAAGSIRVSSATRLLGFAVERTEQVLMVRGALEDDGAQRLADRVLQVELIGPMASEHPSPCDTPPAGLPALVRFATDSAGSFCVAVPLGTQGGQLQVHFAGDGLHEPSTSLIALQPRAEQVVLGFVAAELRANLDAETFPVRVDTHSEQSRPRARPISVTLWLTANGTSRQLGVAERTVLGQPANFAPLSAELGPPGVGELQARFAGDEDSAASEATTRLLKQSRVVLSLDALLTLPPPERGWQLDVTASSRFEPLLSGAIQIQHQGLSVAVARLEMGGAQLFVPDGVLTDAPEVQVSYLPAEPWWLPGTGVTTSLPALPKVSSRPPLFGVVSLLLVALLVWRAWRSPVPRTHQPRTQPALPLITGESQVTILESQGAAAGFQGAVVDAHDGRPLAGVRLELRPASFVNTDRVQEALSDEQGRFALPPAGIPGGATLSVTAAEHRGLIRQLDRPGELLVQLVQRRRALISELVTVEATHLQRAEGAADPTPGQIARGAAQQGREAAHSWARAVEQAAFGRERVDEHKDQQLLELRPGPRGT